MGSCSYLEYVSSDATGEWGPGSPSPNNIECVVVCIKKGTTRLTPIDRAPQHGTPILGNPHDFVKHPFERDHLLPSLMNECQPSGKIG